jgi:ribose transport system permease protein
MVDAAWNGNVTKGLKLLSLPLAIVAALVLFGLLEPRVLTADNLRNVAVQTSFLAIFAMAQCLVILTRGFDLSLGYCVSLVSVVSAMSMVASGSLVLGVLAGLGAGLIAGMVNGVLIGGIALNPLVTTLGTSYILLALASTISGGFPVSNLPAGFTESFSLARPLGLQMPIWIAAGIFVLLFAMLKATRFGRSLYIVGANPRAATAAGIPTFAVLTGAYALAAVLAAIGALLLTARTGSGEPNLGGNLTLESIAAAVVGGVKLSGGEGGVGAALMGALLITILSNGMNLVQVDGYLQSIILGIIIITSLMISRGSNQE